MAIVIGQQAPSFTLYDSETNKVSLENFMGKNVLLLFFPQAFTGVCTIELSNTRDDLSIYDGFKTQILAISVDSVFTLAKYKEEQKFNFPLLSDFNKKVSASYDALYDEFIFGMKGVSKRAAFLIDKKGIIRYAEVLEKATDLPNFEAIRETLTALQKEESVVQQ